MFQHKKFRAALVASLIALMGGYSSGLAEVGDFVQALTFVDWTAVIVPWLFAIAGQGLADWGKEKAKVQQWPLQPLQTGKTVDTSGDE